MSETRTSSKVPYEGQEAEGKPDDSLESKPKANKFKKRDVEIPFAEVDIKLAEKLDNCLSLGPTRKPRFFMNKPNAATGRDQTQRSPTRGGLVDMGSIKPRNLSREELKERLAKKYDTLVPELDPQRTRVKFVKVLSVKESLEMGKEEAKRQLVDQMKLNSVSGNEQAYLMGTESFRFKDGYEIPGKGFYSKKFDAFQKSKTGLIDEKLVPKVQGLDETKLVRTTLSKETNSASKSVKFADEASINETTDKESDPYGFFSPDDDDTLTDDNEEQE